MNPSLRRRRCSIAGAMLPSLLLLTATLGCAAPREVKIVAAAEPEAPLTHRLELDTTRLSRGAADGQWSVAGLVEKHLATVGLVRQGKPEADTIHLVAELPAAGYALHARISPRPEQFCGFLVEVVQLSGDVLKPVASAPWWAIDALESVFTGVSTLRPPLRGPLDEARFARFHAQAAALARSGDDPPITPEAYIHAARPLQARDPDTYYSPASGPSHVLPER